MCHWQFCQHTVTGGRQSSLQIHFQAIFFKLWVCSLGCCGQKVHTFVGLSSQTCTFHFTFHFIFHFYSQHIVAMSLVFYFVPCSFYTIVSLAFCYSCLPCFFLFVCVCVLTCCTLFSTAPEGIPAPVLSIVSTTALRVTWIVPERPNGDITAYNLIVNGETIPTDSTQPGSMILNNLQPYTVYDVQVRSCSLNKLAYWLFWFFFFCFFSQKCFQFYCWSVVFFLQFQRLS